MRLLNASLVRHLLRIAQVLPCASVYLFVVSKYNRFVITIDDCKLSGIAISKLLKKLSDHSPLWPRSTSAMRSVLLYHNHVASVFTSCGNQPRVTLLVFAFALRLAVTCWTKVRRPQARTPKIESVSDSVLDAQKIFSKF